jgi:hypothetical protein
LDAALLLGAKPNKIRIQLLHKYADIEFMRNLVPTLQQIRNRSTALKVKRAETFKIKQIKDNNSIKAYINSKIIASSEAYNSLNSNTECFILHSFDYNTTCQNQQLTTSGFVFTNKILMNNIIKCTAAQPSGLRLSWDGTYKICQNGWTLILFGSTGIRIAENGLIAHHIVPFSCTLTRTEGYESFVGIADAF